MIDLIIVMVAAFFAGWHGTAFWKAGNPYDMAITFMWLVLWFLFALSSNF